MPADPVLSALLAGAGDVLLIGLIAMAGRVTGSWIDLFLPLMLMGLHFGMDTAQ